MMVVVFPQVLMFCSRAKASVPGNADDVSLLAGWFMFIPQSTEN
jgi:hypothetical protein